MKLISVEKSTKPGKKFVATFETDTGKTRSVHFGAEGMDDYTITHDKQQRQRYRMRHLKDLKTNDPTKAGFLSYYILWGNSTDIDTNITTYKKKFKL
jgi:hypothetical protein